MNDALRDCLRELMERFLDDDNVALKVDQLTADQVIDGHNALKELDDMLARRWFALGSPDPDRLQ